MLLSIPMVFSVYTDETETNDRSLSVFKYLQKEVSVVRKDKSLYEKVFDMYKENMYIRMLVCVYTSEVKTNDRSLSVLEYKKCLRRLHWG